MRPTGTRSAQPRASLLGGALVLVAALGLGGAASATTVPEAGDPAPEQQVPTDEGGLYRSTIAPLVPPGCASVTVDLPLVEGVTWWVQTQDMVWVADPDQQLDPRATTVLTAVLSPDRVFEDGSTSARWVVAPTGGDITTGCVDTAAAPAPPVEQPPAPPAPPAEPPAPPAEQPAPALLPTAAPTPTQTPAPATRPAPAAEDAAEVAGALVPVAVERSSDVPAADGPAADLPAAAAERSAAAADEGETVRTVAVAPASATTPSAGATGPGVALLLAAAVGLAAYVAAHLVAARTGWRLPTRRRPPAGGPARG